VADFAKQSQFAMGRVLMDPVKLKFLIFRAKIV